VRSACGFPYILPMRNSVYFTVDLEQDCPPYMSSMRGMEEGFPRLLALLDELGIHATFFTTGDVARRYPHHIRQLIAGSHELGGHGMTHARFTALSMSAARAEIEESTAILRSFAAVRSFRAPYLALREDQLELLVTAGYEVDASLARYKPAHWMTRRRVSPLVRLHASTTPSLMRLPRRVREPVLASLTDPVVLFVHPWEFVDLSREKSLPFDCRFNTGDIALRRLREVLTFFQRRDAHFHPVVHAAQHMAAAA
jgi:peptidoglycan-N-acetylglucosamine deacetylase